MGRLARARGGVRAAGVRGAVPVRPLPVGDERGRAARARRVGDGVRARRRHLDGQARHAGLPGHVPPPLPAGQDGRQRRPHLRRSRRARHRDGLERGGAPCLRLRVPAHAHADGSARGAGRDRAPLVDGRAVLVPRGPLDPRSPRRPPEARAVAASAADHGRRRGAARRGARGALGRRVQRRDGDAGRGRRAARAAAGGVRAGGARPVHAAVLAHAPVRDRGGRGGREGARRPARPGGIRRRGRVWKARRSN